MAKKTTTVSIDGDRNYVNALGAFAKAQHVTIASLVKKALDTTYGSELESFIVFFAHSDALKHQTKQENIDEAANGPS